MSRGFRGFIPVGSVNVPTTFKGGLFNKDKNETNETTRTKKDLREKIATHKKERQEVLPELVEIIKKILEQNPNLEEHLVQLVTVLDAVSGDLICNDYITAAIVPNTDPTLKTINALDRRLDNNGKNMPLFHIDLKTDGNGNIVKIKIHCAKVINNEKYSFDYKDGLSLIITDIDTSVATVSYYNSKEFNISTAEPIKTYEVSNGKKIL